MTALVSLSVGGAVTGFSFVPKAAADISSPTSMPLNLLALRQSVQAQSPQADLGAPSHDALLRAAIVHVADYYLRMAQTKSPAEMEAIIWQHDSVDGADHGQSCAAFASLTLELGAQVVGRESWVSGGSSYPWPLHSWADVRVEPNPASLGIISIQQDAEASHRWHPLGDGYQPLPGDWVLFDGHVEVVTKNAGGVLHTVGGDSLPNFSVNAHQYPEPLSAAGVVGFVNNGSLPDAAQSGGAQSGTAQSGGRQSGSAQSGSAQSGSAQSGSAQPGAAEASARPAKSDRPTQDRGVSAGTTALAAIPGAVPGAPAHTAPAPSADAGSAATPAIPGLVSSSRPGGAKKHQGTHGTTAIPRTGAKTDQAAPGTAAIPGLVAADHVAAKTGSAYRRHHPSPLHKPPSETRAQQAFIDQVAPGAIAAQHRYGVPAAVTIAQAIDESGWGQSQLAAQDHNLFGIKGTGPAGSVPLPTQEYVNGQQVSTSASFRVYHDVAESIDDHGRLLADSGYYQQAMADRQHPNEFAKALTGVYATDPNYGSNLISLMLRYDLYHYGTAGQAQPAPEPAGPAEPAAGSATIPGVGGAPSAAPQPTGSAGRPTASPQPTRTASPAPTRTASPQPTGTASPQPTRTASPGPTRTASPGPTRTASPEPTRTASPRPSETASPQPSRTASPKPTRTVSPQPTRTGSPKPTRTASPQPTGTASPQPTGTASPQPTRTASPRSTRTPSPTAPSPSRRGSAPAATPSPASAQADIPGVTTQSVSDSATTSAVRFGPAAPFVPVAESESDTPMTSAVRFGPEAPFVPVDWSASARPASARPVPPRPVPSRSVPARPAPGWMRSAPAARAAGPVRSGPARAPARATLVSARRYQPQIPRSVLNSFVETAKGPLVSEESFYRDVASFHGISWELLAACDWMQCDARPKRSPVYGEKLGAMNADGTVYTSKSAALARCASDLVTLARAVYGIDLTSGAPLSVRDLANAFAAFRWGRVLKDHDFSAMKFPYSVAGLTENHLGLRWPEFAPPNSGDRPRGRFHRRFGAVPIVLSLDYPATV
jgi:flagellum-specific peptidoglycan hydrolase FlgJ